MLVMRRRPRRAVLPYADGDPGHLGGRPDVRPMCTIDALAGLSGSISVTLTPKAGWWSVLEWLWACEHAPG